ncbi:MAG: RHS repeat-associated core domain-containing protein [Bryobacteraceae bacterium]|nr:RHS repeat-associated core domain-containing protein [Bryobacteraceae bacterium]
MRWFNLSGGGSQTETRQYNALGQLTRLTVPGQLDLEYCFSATANDGRATSQKNYISGEELEYQYDSLGRLTKAETTANSGAAPQWGLSWTYDGFGNRLQQNAVKGTVPTASLLVDPTNNRVQSHTYDANGNTTNAPGPGAMTYDVLNRLKTVATDTYSYAPTNQRLWKNNDFVLWGADGARLVTAQLAVIGGELRFTQSSFDSYSHGRRLQVADRLGSVGSYYPYGEAKSGTVSNADGFATYYRDSTGLDYAQNRHYQSTTGRFTTTDPLQASAKASNPASWNRYDYALSDPANRFDPQGLESDGSAQPSQLPQPACVQWPGSLNFFCSVVLNYAFGTFQASSFTADLKTAEMNVAAILNSFEFTQSIVQAAANAINRSGLSSNCMNYLSGTVVSRDRASFTVRDTLPDGTVVNRLDPLAVIVGSAARVRFRDGLNAANPAIAQLFNRSDIYVRAYTSGRPVDGNIIYWRPGDLGLFRGSSWVLANVLHELLHDITGLGDSDLQEAFGLEPDVSDNITSQLMQRCFLQ